MPTAILSYQSRSLDYTINLNRYLLWIICCVYLQHYPVANRKCSTLLQYNGTESCAYTFRCDVHFEILKQYYDRQNALFDILLILQKHVSQMIKEQTSNLFFTQPTPLKFMDTYQWHHEMEMLSTLPAFYKGKTTGDPWIPLRKNCTGELC